MSIVYYTICDMCGKKQDNEMLSPTFHELTLGGSDFDTSHSSQEERTYHFCSLGCMHEKVSEWLVPSNNSKEI